MLPIATARLRLRELLPEDAQPIANLIGNWNVVRWLALPPFPYTIADADEFILRMRTLEPKPGCATAAITRDGQLIGIVGIDQRQHGMEFGYWLGEPYWGNGYASEAAAALVAAYFAAPGTHDLNAGYFEGNLASARILTKLGFREIRRGTLFNRAHQKQMPDVAMLLTRADFRELPS